MTEAPSASQTAKGNDVARVSFTDLASDDSAAAGRGAGPDRKQAVVAKPMGKSHQADIVCIADVKPERVQWLWHGRIPLGKVTLFQGDPGVGKSTVAFDISARVTNGADMPRADSEPTLAGNPAASVVLLTAEDGLGDTVRPRLEAAGADLNRVHAIQAVTREDGQKELPSLPRDIPLIEHTVRSRGAKLVVIDPITAYLGARVDSWKDQDVRKALSPLAAMAESTGAAVLVVAHLNKKTEQSAMYRGGGSIGIIAAARSALLFAKDPDDPEGSCVVAPVKANLARFAPSLRYSLEDVPALGVSRVRWAGVSPYAADELLSKVASQAPRDSKLAQAVEFVRRFLSNGPLESKAMSEAAAKEGIAGPTLARARRELGVVAMISRETHSWKLRLPAQQPADRGGG